MPTRDVLLTAGLVLALLSPLGSTAQAQEPAGAREAPVLFRSSERTIQVRTDQPRARLGRFLDASCALPDSAAVCDRPPVIVSVVEGGPADRAGVRQLDTLVALDGRSLSTPEGRRALQSLESGTSILLSLSGPEGRREIAVIPEIRAPAHVMQFEWRSPDAAGVGEQIRMYRFPSDEADGEFEIRLDSIIAEDSEGAFVMFGPDSDGQLRVEVVGAERGTLRSRVEAGTWEGVTTGYVVESQELAKRLEEVRDRTLRIARIQLDHLMRLQDGGVEIPVASNRRVAGAEFLALTPELAEYFAGVHDGLLVLRVIPKTPASQLGLRDGDVVIEADGNPVRTIEVFRTRILHADPQGMAVKWMRKGVEVGGRLTGP